MEKEINLTQYKDKGFQILYQNKEVGFMDIYGYVNITDPKILQTKKIHHEVRMFCKDYFNQVANEDVAKWIESKNSKYEIVAREYETSSIRSYKFFNLKKEAQTVAEIVESRKVNCYDNQIPLQHVLKIYRKALQKDKFLPINETVEKMSKLDEEQFNSILMAYALHIDQTHIDEMLDAQFSAKQCFIYTQIILFACKKDIQDYLIHLLKLDLPETLIYSMFIYFLYEDDLQLVQRFVDSYLANTSESNQFYEIILSLINGLKLQEIIEGFTKLPSSKMIREKRILLQNKKYLDTNLPNIEEEAMPCFGEAFSLTSSFQIQQFLPTIQKLEQEKIKFSLFKKKESKQVPILIEDFIPTKLSYGEVDKHGANVFYDGKVLATINLDRQFILVDEYKNVEDSIITQIKQFAMFMTSEKEGIFQKHQNKLRNEFDIQTTILDRKTIFKLENKSEDEFTIIGEINENSELLITDNTYKFAKEFMVGYWLFEYKKNEKFILNQSFIVDNLKDKIIQSILQGYCIEDLKYLLYLNKDEENLFKLYHLYIQKNPIDLIKMEYEKIQQEKQNSVLQQAEFIDSVDKIFQEEYNFFSKHYLTDGKIKTEIPTYKFQPHKLLFTLKEELQYDQYMLAKRKIKEFLSDKGV